MITTRQAITEEKLRRLLSPTGLSALEYNVLIYFGLCVARGVPPTTPMVAEQFAIKHVRAARLLRRLVKKSRLEYLGRSLRLTGLWWMPERGS